MHMIKIFKGKKSLQNIHRELQVIVGCLVLYYIANECVFLIAETPVLLQEFISSSEFLAWSEIATDFP